MGLPLVAIVGRPNVGKSTLFNRLTRSRAAVVHAESGVTRDRHIRGAEWKGVGFLLADTGGMLPFEDEESFARLVTEVARETYRTADLILFVVDVASGVTDLDAAVARELRGLDKPVLVVVNKADADADVFTAPDFYRLGLGDPHAVSALHGRGTGDLLDAVVAQLPHRQPEPRRDLRVALVGRPNVGKSSLLNALVGSPVSLVSPVSGTTRDAIDTPLRWHGHRVVLVDTAGIRRRARHHKGVEYFAILRSIQAIQRCDVAVLLVDATSGVVAQDQRIAGEIHHASRGAVIVLNKWDAIEKDDKTYLRHSEEVRDRLGFLSYAPIVTLSATAGTRIGRVLELAWTVHEARQKKVETSKLNDILQRAQAKNPPKVHNRGTGKVLYATQTGLAPPTFTLFVNRASFFARNYLRYLNNRIRAEIGFPGTRIHLELRERK